MGINIQRLSLIYTIKLSAKRYWTPPRARVNLLDLSHSCFLGLCLYFAFGILILIMSVSGKGYLIVDNHLKVPKFNLPICLFSGTLFFCPRTSLSYVISMGGVIKE